MKIQKIGVDIIFGVMIIVIFITFVIFFGEKPKPKTELDFIGKITNISFGEGTTDFILGVGDKYIGEGDYSYRKVEFVSARLTSKKSDNHKGLILRASQEIIIDKNSEIDFTGTGNMTKVNDGSGLDYDYSGGGGSFSGVGGSGSCLVKETSESVSNDNVVIEFGNPGGKKKNAETTLVPGGGYIMLVAPKVRIDGTILVNGVNGNDFLGGGSGGKIVIISNDIVINGLVMANGGKGGNSNIQGAGGGGGGLIILNSKQKGTGKMQVNGGKGGRALDPYTGCPGSNGSNGKILVAR